MYSPILSGNGESDILMLTIQQTALEKFLLMDLQPKALRTAHKEFMKCCKGSRNFMSANRHHDLHDINLLQAEINS